MEKQRLTRSFYLQEDVVSLAQSFLGKFLCTQINEKYTCGMIVETEAYKAPEDYGSHAFGNKRTARTEAMFCRGGAAYVYFIYGVYKLFNIVTHKAGIAHAVLVRGLEPIEGIDVMLTRRRMDRPKRNLTAGPGLLTEALGIDLQHNKTTLTGNIIWLEDRGMIIPEDRIITSPRVGLNIAEPYKSIPWRFRIQDNPWTSPAK